MNDKEKCRLCLMQTNVSVSLFTENGAKMLENITNIKISLNDKLPSKACIKCWLNLKLAYQYCQNFIEADKILHSQTIITDKVENDITDKVENDITDQVENDIKTECLDNFFTGIENEECTDFNFIDKSLEDEEEIIEIKFEEIGNEDNEKCPICAQEHSSSTIYLHLKEHYMKKQTCEVCNTNSENIKAHRQHLISCHNFFPEIYNCDVCHATFQYKSFYTLHMKNFHTKATKRTYRKKPKVDLTLECTICNKTFTTKSKYWQHIKGHQRGKCPICDAEVSKYNLSKHVMLHNSGPSVCHLCGMTLKNIESLRGHLHYTHSKKKLSCEYCGKIFTKLYSRSLHIKKEHTGEKSFICDTCGKSFFTQYTLNKHVKMTHLKLRPHICQYCDKAFSTRFAMRTHERQHTQETPYVCTICGEGFRQNVSLRAHKKSKHNIIEDKKFDCKVCCKMFVSEWAVKSHMRLH